MQIKKILFDSISIRSLEDNKYDHITATYFLIAEKLLKKSYGSTAFHLKLEDRRSFPYEETRCHRYDFQIEFSWPSNLFLHIF